MDVLKFCFEPLQARELIQASTWNICDDVSSKYEGRGCRNYVENFWQDGSELGEERGEQTMRRLFQGML
jgi:hypothetical protein